MKKSILKGLTLAVILAATTISLSAQPQQRRQKATTESEVTTEKNEKCEKKTPLTPEEFATKVSEKMAEKYSLSTAQTKKVYQLNLELAKAKQQARELQKGLTKSTLALLNDDQKIEYMESMAKMKGRKMAHKGGSRQMVGKRGGKGGDQQQHPQMQQQRGRKMNMHAKTGAKGSKCTEGSKCAEDTKGTKRAEGKRAPRPKAEANAEASAE